MPEIRSPLGIGLVLITIVAYQRYLSAIQIMAKSFVNKLKVRKQNNCGWLADTFAFERHGN